MDKVEPATWEICCRNCAPTKPGGVIPERPRNGFLTSITVQYMKSKNFLSLELRNPVASPGLAQIKKTRRFL